MSTVSIKHNQTASLTFARFCGIAFGIGTQLLFLWTVVQQFLFLRYGGTQNYKPGLFVDCLLSIGFALPPQFALGTTCSETNEKLDTQWAVGLFYSLHITGMGYQTGLTQWWYWMRRQRPPQRVFVKNGVYRCMRHPIYMSFLGLIWFAPTMTLDHAVLTGIWTAYIYAGSYAKDQRMLRFVGAEYREYAARVSGLPFIGFGPLLRIPHSRL